MNKSLLALAFLLASFAPAAAVNCPGFAGGNYYGYCQNNAAPYTSIQATYQVPLIAYNGPASPNGATDVLIWIGIGSNLSTQIQAGAAHQLNPDGSYSYQAWTGAGSIQLISATTYPLKPGDSYTISIICRTNCTPSAVGQTWDFDLSDVHLDGTTWTFARHGFGSVQDLAFNEVALEAAIYGAAVAYVPNFGIVPWKNILVNGANPNLTVGQEEPGTDPKNNTINVSAPNSTTDGYVACYGEGGAYATCGSVPNFVRTISGGIGR